MSHHPIREEKNCLNCGTTVEERFCPKCGQENTINRPSFHYLFTHFAEDFVHYDSGFWKTLRTLLFKPGKIIRDYLDGKRKTYMPPVKLYIFVSFVVFFIPYILPSFGEEDPKDPLQKVVEENQKFEGIEVKKDVFATSTFQLDSIQNSLPANQKIPSIEYAAYQATLKGIENSTVVDGNDLTRTKGVFAKNGISVGPYKNVRTLEELDSIDAHLSNKEKPNWASKKLIRKVVELRDRYYQNEENMWEKGWETFVHNLPKALFFYLPIFAFLLWLMHSRKKWLYYDHGVFTLYYFSFLLIFILLTIVWESIFSCLTMLLPSWSGFFDFLNLSTVILGLLYVYFYFFRAHSTVYMESKAVSRVKSFILFFLNLFVFCILLMIYTLITFMIM